MRECLLALCLLPLLEHAEAEEITLTTELGPLAATLERPSEGRIRAMVLLIAGSGPTDRNGNSFALPGRTTACGISPRLCSRSASVRCASTSA